MTAISKTQHVGTVGVGSILPASGEADPVRNGRIDINQNEYDDGAKAVEISLIANEREPMVRSVVLTGDHARYLAQLVTNAASL
jgi:hypothetical protein